MNIFIGCSASDYIDKVYYDDTRELLNVLMKDNNLVFGACHSGLMGVAHDITKDFGNKVIGVCPSMYVNDFDTLDCDEEIVSSSVSDRTTGLISNSDILLFIPGGIGTVYELFTAIETKRCHEHDKPIIIYNSNGFYNKLLEFLDMLYAEKFVRENDRRNYYIASTQEEVIDCINKHKMNVKAKKKTIE